MKKNETEKKALWKDQKEIRIYHAPVTEWEKNMAKVHGVIDYTGRRS